MKLTGKAKKDFFKQSKFNETVLRNINELFLNALIIEWFDSVGIYIASQWFDKNWIFSVERQPFKQHHYKDFGFNTRTEATNAAIEKANELYNYENR